MYWSDGYWNIHVLILYPQQRDWNKWNMNVLPEFWFPLWFLWNFRNIFCQEANLVVLLLLLPLVVSWSLLLSDNNLAHWEGGTAAAMMLLPLLCCHNAVPCSAVVLVWSRLYRCGGFISVSLAFVPHNQLIALSFKTIVFSYHCCLHHCLCCTCCHHWLCIACLQFCCCGCCILILP